MSSSRKIQRSVRVTVAAVLMGLAVLAVVACVATQTFVSVAAVGGVVAGCLAARIVYSEVRQTRQEWARDRAAQAKAFGATIKAQHEEHTEYIALMTDRVASRDRTITELNGTLRLAEKRADYAEDRVKREAQRANEAQERFASLLDEVLEERRREAEAAQADAEVVADAVADVPGRRAAADDETDLGNLPTLVNLLDWEDRNSAELLERARAEAAAERGA